MGLTPKLPTQTILPIINFDEGLKSPAGFVTDCSPSSTNRVNGVKLKT